MKICWDNLEKFYFTKNGNFRNIDTKNTYHYIEYCKVCNEPFLSQNKNSKYCDYSCSIKDKSLLNNKGYKNSFYGKYHSEKTKKKISKKQIDNWNNGNYNNVIWNNKKENNPNWKGGNYCECGELIHKQRIRCDKCLKKYRKEIKNKRKNRNLYPSNWNSIAKKIRKRDNYKCQNPYCDVHNGYIKLEVHHIDYNKYNCIDENLISICVVCHIQTNYDRDWHRSFYSEIIRRKYMSGVLH